MSSLDQTFDVVWVFRTQRIHVLQHPLKFCKLSDTFQYSSHYFNKSKLISVIYNQESLLLQKFSLGSVLSVANAKKWSWQSQTSELILTQCYSVLRKYILYFSNAHFRYGHSKKINWEIISEDRNKDHQRHNKGYSLKRMEIRPASWTKELTPLPGRNLTIPVQLDEICVTEK